MQRRPKASGSVAIPVGNGQDDDNNTNEDRDDDNNKPSSQRYSWCGYYHRVWPIPTMIRRRRTTTTTTRRHSTYALFVCGSLLLLCIILSITRTLGIRIFPKPMKTSETVLAKHIPYPPSDIAITAIVMNHARPYVLQQSMLLQTLTKHPNVQEILILHSNPQTIFDNEQLRHLQHLEKIRHINATQANKDWGLAIRFKYCSEMAKYPWILHMDDDMEFDESAITELITSMQLDSHRIVGHYGRSYSYWKAPFRYGYDTHDQFGNNVEVILTKFMLLEKNICHEFMKYHTLMNDMVPLSQPKWNGEDIFVNLIANHYYHVPVHGPYHNLALADLNVWEADLSKYTASINDEVSVSGNMDRNRIWNVGPITFWKAYRKAQIHTAYRGRLWYLGRKRLAEITTKQQSGAVVTTKVR